MVEPRQEELHIAVREREGRRRERLREPRAARRSEGRSAGPRERPHSQKIAPLYPCRRHSTITSVIRSQKARRTAAPSLSCFLKRGYRGRLGPASAKSG